MSLAITSCTLLQEAGNQLIDSRHETITIELPAWPDYLPELYGWKIELQDSSSSKIISSDSLEIKVNKNKPLCIKAQPIVKCAQNNKSSFFKCAGAIYPYDFCPDKQTIELTWSGGYAASLMKSLINSGQSISDFNWGRLSETLKEKQDNPWLLNTPKVLEGISTHSFSAIKLKVSGTLSVTLDFPVFSSYVPENEAIRQSKRQNQYSVTIKKEENCLFALDNTNFSTGLLIYGTSIKNISLEFISLPIYIIEEI